MNILLDYVFSIAAIEPTPAANTAFLKKACVVAKPKSGQEGNVGSFFTCSSMSDVAARTDNTDAQQLFNAGMSSVIILLADDLDLASFIEGHESDFFTLLISSDFDDDDIEPDQAQGVFTVSSYANLVSGTADTVTIAGQAFTAQAGAVTPGEAKFQAATSNDATAASLAAQINAHEVIGALVEATAVGAVVTVKAIEPGSAGNDIAASYTDNDTNVGGAWTGLSGGKLAGGDGYFDGVFSGVIGMASDDDEVNEERAATSNMVGFHTSGSNGVKNMFYAFGKLLSNLLSWKNQQYVEMPFADDVDTLGEALNLFDKKISFVMDDSQYGKRLGLFAQGGKAIVAPYITRNLELDLQSKALQYISGNQPGYTKVQAALLEDELQKVIDSYIAKAWIEAGVIEVKLEQDNFVASGYINISEPKAMWRIIGEMRQTL